MGDLRKFAPPERKSELAGDVRVYRFRILDEPWIGSVFLGPVARFGKGYIPLSSSSAEILVLIAIAKPMDIFDIEFSAFASCYLLSLRELTVTLKTSFVFL